MKLNMLVAGMVVALTGLSGPALAQGGSFQPYYDEPASPEYRDLYEFFAGMAYMEEAADLLNDAVNLPSDIRIGFQECGQPNAFYQPGTQTIAMCYELAAFFFDLFAAEGDELEAAVMGAFTFTFFHEVGHALIDVLELPATGMEEDAVDQLAATILLGTDEFAGSGAASVMDAAMWFLANAERDASSGAGFADLPFHGEHSLNPVRYFNLVCWVYGSNPQEFAFLRGETLPEARAARCPTEFARFSGAWEALLIPHLR